MNPSPWLSVSGEEIRQGDWLNECLIPHLPADLASMAASPVRLDTKNLIVITQSCDLFNQKAGVAALCPIETIAELEAANPSLQKKGVWEEVRKGRREGLYLLASPDTPTIARASMVVNFRSIFTLPIPYLTSHASTFPRRWRLQSPFLEHFSQAFARFFMRVGLPSAVPPFTD